MGLVRAKKYVYLGEHGDHAEGSEFEYNGPDNENLESIEAGPYRTYSDAELRDEIRRRGLTYVAVATHKDLEAVLAEDDSRADALKVEPKEPIPKQGPRGDSKKQYEKFMLETSGGFHSTDDDWTTVGIDVSGFPVPKGSPEDVSQKPNPPERKAGLPE